MPRKVRTSNLLYTNWVYGDSIDWDTLWAAIVDDIPVDLAAITRIREALH